MYTSSLHRTIATVANSCIEVLLIKDGMMEVKDEDRVMASNNHNFSNRRLQKHGWRTKFRQVIVITTFVIFIHSSYKSIIYAIRRKSGQKLLPSSTLLESVLFLNTPDFDRNSRSLTGVQSMQASLREEELKNSTLLATSEDEYNFRPNNMTHFAIFYNIYVANDQGDEGIERAKRIIEEQLDQVGSSNVIVKGTVTLFYNTIGRELAENYIEAVCQRNHLDCRLMQHYEKGYEDLTLQRVHEFCNVHENYRVIYMHSKGSYHDWEYENFSQNTWRWFMTSAVTDGLCLEPPHDSCDICGLSALPWPNLHFAGNFFTAKCSYIKKLLPPKQFVKRMNTVAAQVLYRKLEGLFSANLLPDGPHHYGIGRFASEHWLGSHPSVSACDLSESADIKVWQNPNKTLVPKFKYAMYPRHNVMAPWAYMYRHLPNYIDTFRDPVIRRKEYFLLAGNVYRWYELYNEVPSSQSWVWSWYPDGKDWLDAIQKYGRNAVDVMALNPDFLT